VTWRLRAPAPADADRVAEINVRGWQHAYAGLMPAELLAGLETAPRAERLRARFAQGGSADGYVVTDADDVVRGYCWFGDYRPDDDAPDPGLGSSSASVAEWGEIYAIYVDPDFIGTGAGAALMRAALADLEPRPVAVWVLEGNTHARTFYERFGFRLDGARTDFDAGGTPVPEVRCTLVR
jgi:GNAT superfamily N-acetyltransferase